MNGYTSQHPRYRFKIVNGYSRTTTRFVLTRRDRVVCNVYLADIQHSSSVLELVDNGNAVRCIFQRPYRFKDFADPLDARVKVTAFLLMAGVGA